LDEHVNLLLPSYQYSCWCKDRCRSVEDL